MMASVIVKKVGNLPLRFPVIINENKVTLDK